jgi:hypothetical protein
LFIQFLLLPWIERSGISDDGDDFLSNAMDFSYEPWMTVDVITTVTHVQGTREVKTMVVPNKRDMKSM